MCRYLLLIIIILVIVYCTSVTNYEVWLLKLAFFEFDVISIRIRWDAEIFSKKPITWIFFYGSTVYVDICYLKCNYIERMKYNLHTRNLMSLCMLCDLSIHDRKIVLKVVLPIDVWKSFNSETTRFSEVRFITFSLL